MLDGGEPDSVQVGYDVLKLDRDGLPDRYEETVVGTDPLDPDSDSRFTEPDESDQGLLDGAKDFDGDELSTFQEYRLGTDPLAADTTGDGLEDGFQVLPAGTDPLSNDTDGDGTPDVAEDLSGDGLTLIEEQEHGTHPRVNDTDGDGLLDGKEVNGWTEDVVNKTDGSYVDENPYRWDSGQTLGPNETEGSVRFDANPLEVDSDGDGIDDRKEKEMLHTDPRSNQTYGITVEHQEEIVKKYDQDTLVPIGLDPTRLSDHGLTDRTDDFDFVRPEDDRLTFWALDRSWRTDTWLSNQEELEYGRDDDGERLDPWDPDTDDDGLTDGQELKGVIRVTNVNYEDPRIKHDSAVSPVQDPVSSKLDGVSPTNPDSDGDGYWDGWIGVYGVERSDNVILYGENLQGNVTGHERVDEQIGYHELSSTVTHSNVGVDIDGDGVREHSNVHMGELLFGTDPTDDLGSGVPSTAVSLEMDFFHDASDAVRNANWRQRIERNYRLYGVGLDIRYDDRHVYKGELGNMYCDAGIERFCRYYTSPFDKADIVFINTNLKSLGTDYYMFVADRAADDGPVLYPEQTGSHMAVEVPELNHQVIDTAMVYTDAHLDERIHVPGHLGLTHDEELRALTAKTAVHEFGHQLSIGEADDQAGVEVYSGCQGCSINDPTHEEVKPKNSPPVDEWSVMSSGPDSEQYLPPTNADYVAFSIEELLTIELSGMER